jgi:predicted nucleic acid-binding protein
MYTVIIFNTGNAVLITSLFMPKDTSFMSFDPSRLAGMLRHKEIQGGIADAIILATARIGYHTIVTGDQHFQNLPDVVFIGDT